MAHTNPIHADNRKDTLDYIEALRKLQPEEPDINLYRGRTTEYKKNFQDFQEKVKAWQKLLSVGKKWMVLRNQEDFPDGAKLFDELGKALTRRK